MACVALLRLQYIYEHFSRRGVSLDVYMRRVDSVMECTSVLESLGESDAPVAKNAQVHVIMDIAIEKLQRLILSEIRKRRGLRFNYHYLTVAVVSTCFSSASFSFSSFCLKACLLSAGHERAESQQFRRRWNEHYRLANLEQRHSGSRSFPRVHEESQLDLQN